jgi:methionyl-tRNA synthetase
MRKKIYLTTPIFYTNGKPHLGHLHTCFLGSFFSNAFRYFDYEVFFLTGTDEHGQKIMNTAIKQNITPQELVDQNSQIFKNFMKDFHINYDCFIRTTDTEHKNNVLDIWSILEKKKYLYKGIYKGLYAEKDECFYSLEETELNNNNERIAKSSGNKIEELEEECIFFKLSDFKYQLLEFYKNNYFVLPYSLQKELIQYVLELKDLCVSRRVAWGIKIPHSDSTIYVWLDALSNYITAIGGVKNYNKKLWTNSLHIIGKDILIFHGVYWVAILMALDITPPRNLLVHGWWLDKHIKMSKSLENVIDPYLIKKKDYLRYYCLKQELIGHDGNFDKNHMIDIINNELIGKILNLIYRVFSLIKQKYFCSQEIILTSENSREDITKMKNDCLNVLLKFSPKAYINIILEYSSICNQYIDKNTIWVDCSIQHLNFLLPIIHEIINLLDGVLIETISYIKTLYIWENKNNNQILFTLIHLNPFFEKMDINSL